MLNRQNLSEAVKPTLLSVPPTHPRRIFSPQELVKCGNQIRSCERICQKRTHSLLQTNKVSFRPPNKTLIDQILKFPSIWFTNPVLTKMKYFLTIIVLCLKSERCQQWACFWNYSKQHWSWANCQCNHHWIVVIFFKLEELFVSLINWQLCRHEEVDLSLQSWGCERTNCQGTLPTHGTKSFA